MMETLTTLAAKLSRTMFARGCLALALALVSLATAPRADACTCNPDSMKPDLGALHIFEGKVVKLDRDRPNHRLTATLSVDKLHKGTVSGKVQVATIDEGSMCGFSFSMGESYLIYATALDPPFDASLCSPNKLLADAAADLKLLAEDSAPPAAPATSPAEEPPPVAPPAPDVAPPPPAAPVPPSAPPQTGCGSCHAGAAAPALPWWVLAALLIAWRRRAARHD